MVENSLKNFKDLKEIGVNKKNCIDLTRVMDYWKILVSAELNLLVPKALEL